MLTMLKKIISKFSKIALRNKVKATIKFQLRDYDTYIHKDAVKMMTNT